jgi:putative restriction endonuclease
MISDQAIITATFNRVRYLEIAHGENIPWEAILNGLTIREEKIFIANKARGIFKPRQMERGVLSIKTTIPKAGRMNPYSDEEISAGYFHYSLQQGDPNGGGNKYLKQAMVDKSPFVYFFAIAPAVYKAIWPCYVASIDDKSMTSKIVVGVQEKSSNNYESDVLYEVPTHVERAYRVAETRARIHQSSFREQVLSAYSFKCAITSLPVPALLEAAHITPDSEPGGDALVTNGIALSRLHHKAFDANLLGIDVDFRIHISSRLLDIRDGVLLEQGLKEFQGKKIALPTRANFAPCRDRLKERFTEYLNEQ